MSLKIVDTKVVFEYTVNGQKRSVTNWAVGVSDGFWRRAFATRYVSHGGKATLKNFELILRFEF